ncbi:Pseudouridine synthase [Olea europaea subsp. europaea]|uniref:tRNA pseudouridine(55) synthase n=1 Tax=Olea europaea subsp. europaea TaxID=158383 RepID=A0A8S0SYP9_OLEEU|nr:Pseudouridine synthase [Olea europaea subsp. europaea]
MFFEGSESERERKDLKMGDVTENKVEDFFKSLKKVPSKNNGDITVVELFFSTRNIGLPPKWDGPNGTVVLVNKPKGSRLIYQTKMFQTNGQFEQVGHAGNLDPMATGLLIVCVGKLVER